MAAVVVGSAGGGGEVGASGWSRPAVGRTDGGPRRWGWRGGASVVGRTGGGEDERGPSMAVADRWWAGVVDRRGGALADSGVAMSGSTEWADDTFEKESVWG